jgi:hypothetical protein
MKRPNLKSRRGAIFWLAAFLLTADKRLSGETASYPQAKEPLVIQRISGSVTLDGLSSEDGWKDIRPLPLVMFLPNYGNPPSEKTEILIGFDDVHLYVAARLYDREPAKIQAPSKKRDYFESNTEWFGVVIDTFNDKENALGFCTTPSGLRWDDSAPGTWAFWICRPRLFMRKACPRRISAYFRARRRVFNPYSYVGGMITTRLGADGSYNTVYGLDGTFRVQGDDYLLLNWAQSFETGKDNNPGSLDPARFRISWERRIRKGLVFNEGLNTNRGRDIPYRPYYSGRAVMIKYSYTFLF